VIGFFVLLGVLGWHPTDIQERGAPTAIEASH
jgi:hypothetical protein